MKEEDDINKLSSYILTLDRMNSPCYYVNQYFHMGATISDAILQAGLNYKTVVFPRIVNLMQRYPDYSTTCDFIILFKTKPLHELLQWNNEIKLCRIENVAWLLFNEGVENENDLSKWLCDSNNIDKLSNLKGIGLKTIDYLKKLVGLDSIPIDRHLFKFMRYAGINTDNYEYAHKIYVGVAEKLGMQKCSLDNMVWNYMSNKTIKFNA